MKNILIILLFFITSALYSQEWHKTQLGTGIGNCGPASVAMAIEWSTGENISVEEVRDIIGYRNEDGATSLDELINTLKLYTEVEYTSFDLVFDNSIYIVHIDTSYITYSEDEFGKDYDWNGGHYIVVYAEYGQYYMVSDPLSTRDGNFYLKDEVERALRSSRVIKIKRDPPSRFKQFFGE